MASAALSKLKQHLPPEARSIVRRARARTGRQLADRLPGLAADVCRRAGPVNLTSLYEASRVWTTDGRTVLRELTGVDDVPADPFVDARRRILDRVPQTARRYASDFPIEEQTAAVLFGLTTIMRPRVVLETGVADGYSTAVILAGLDHVGEGMLHSIDIADDVGVLVDDPAQRWTLHVVPGGDGVSVVAARVGPIDIFFHDCSHSYLGQHHDYRAAWARLRPGGILASDDVNYSWAFYDFCVEQGTPPICLLDLRKVSGFVKKPDDLP
jgi:predicted O-methyltransferase YrrM